MKPIGIVDNPSHTIDFSSSREAVCWKFARILRAVLVSLVSKRSTCSFVDSTSLRVARKLCPRPSSSTPTFCLPWTATFRMPQDLTNICSFTDFVHWWPSVWKLIFCLSIHIPTIYGYCSIASKQLENRRMPPLRRWIKIGLHNDIFCYFNVYGVISVACCLNQWLTWINQKGSAIRNLHSQYKHSKFKVVVRKKTVTEYDYSTDHSSYRDKINALSCGLCGLLTIVLWLLPDSRLFKAIQTTARIMIREWEVKGTWTPKILLQKPFKKSSHSSLPKNMESLGAAMCCRTPSTRNICLSIW